MVVYLPNISELAELSFDGEFLRDPQEDLEFRKYQADHGIKDIESGASNNDFDSGEEPEDEFDPDYDPSSNRQVNQGIDFLVRLPFEPHMYIVQLVGQMNLMLVMALYIVSKSFQLL